MDKGLLEKIKKAVKSNKIGTTSPYANILTNTKYKNYELRGIIIGFSDPIYYIGINNEIALAYYNLFLFVLLNDKLKKSLDNRSYAGDLPIFTTFNENIFAELINNSKYNYNQSSKVTQLILYEGLKGETATFSVKKNDLRINENRYLDNSIQEKKDIILLDMDIELDFIGIQQKIENVEINYPKKIYSLPVFNFSDYGKNNRIQLKYNFNLSFPLDNFINILYDTICIDFDYQYLPRTDYFTVLRGIGNLAWEWIDKNKITNKYLKYLNTIQSEIKDRSYPFTNFCYKFLDELIADLISEKQISQCQFCGDFFQYKKEKKYCSPIPKYENKNCSRQAADRRRYLRKKFKNLTK